MQSFNASPVAMVKSVLINRTLIYVLIRREIIGRYKGSMLGILWSFFTPAFMLVVYTFVFKARWSGGSESKSEFVRTTTGNRASTAFGAFSIGAADAGYLLVSRLDQRLPARYRSVHRHHCHGDAVSLTDFLSTLDTSAQLSGRLAGQPPDVAGGNGSRCVVLGPDTAMGVPGDLFGNLHADCLRRFRLVPENTQRLCGRYMSGSVWRLSR